MGQAVQLEWIMVMSAGLERMPFKAIEEKQVRVTNARGIHKVPMGEYTMSMLLQTYRQEKLISENEGNQIWDKTVRVKEITGKTILIVGAGAIRSEEHTSELQSRGHLVCRLLLEKKKNITNIQ